MDFDVGDHFALGPLQALATERKSSCKPTPQ
jgi:hypothetical protein